MTSRARWNVPIGIAAIAGPILAAGPAAGQVQDQKLLVQAVIGEACTVTSASLDFGSEYDGSAAVSASGTIAINCISETNVGVALDGGLNDGGGGGARAMTGAGNPLQYTLYTDAPGSDPWEAGEVVQATIAGSGSVPVHGVIPQQANGHEPGLHTDEVTITLSF